LQFPDFHIDNRWIVDLRGPKNRVNPKEPYAFHVEKEHQPNGEIEDVATIFLTNRECPFRCLVCDLWKNTMDETVPLGAIPQQIEFALERLPPVRHIKLYNSGNFFDSKAIPVKDYQKIADLLSGFSTILVENHPKLMNSRLLDFQQLLNGELQVGIGLETVHPEVLPKLNKQMTLDDFHASVQFLKENNILSRAFILLRPPFLTEKQGVEWANKSIDFAFKCGVECCAIIPTRAGNGAMEVLKDERSFDSPNIASLEYVLEYGLSLNKGRVFADVWDLDTFSSCDLCYGQRKERLNQMNLNQKVIASVVCTCR
jgi:hypothetical protein